METNEERAMRREAEAMVTIWGLNKALTNLASMHTAGVYDDDEYVVIYNAMMEGSLSA